MKTVTVRPDEVIVLGHQGENLAQRVVWPDIASAYARDYGTGVFTLAVRRKGDAVPYPAAISVERDSVVWVVSDADTEQEGFGECELAYIVGDTVVKSQTWSTQALKSITAEGISSDPPEPQKSWVEQVMQAGAVVEASAASVTEALARHTQLEPEFANSVEELNESGDTSKLYVLPDGYIYAYMPEYEEGGVTPDFVNQIPLSTDTDGSVYNGQGFKADTYLNSSGAPASRAGLVCSGLIPFGAGSSVSASGEWVVRLAGITAPLTSNFRIGLYKAGKVFAQMLYGTLFDDNSYNIPIPYELDESGNCIKIDLTAFTANLKQTSIGEISYIRISCPKIDGDSVLTVNEEITYATVEGGTVYAWANTGHVFVSADYDGRISAAEDGIDKNAAGIEILKSRTTDLEADVETLKEEHSTAPDAVKAAASALVDKALSRDDQRVLRFLISSDAHHKPDNALITRGTNELAQAHGEILRLIGVDFVANLGDVIWGSSTSDNAAALAEAKAFNRFMLGQLRGETQLWTEGNHETDLLTASQIQGLFFSHNRDLRTDPAHWVAGYGYMDLPNQKVRVICLNTNQGTAAGNVSGMSNEQLKWFAETALDMTGKSDWSVITMGHHPLSYNTASLFRYAVETVKAFINGDDFSFTTNDGFTFGIDYSGKNCQYVGHFHGHAHSFSVVKMQRWVGENTYEEINAWEICIPNACYERNNSYVGNGQYTERYSTPVTYSKTDEAGKRTSFNLITVCLNKKKIYADHYGAGIDREVSY